MKKIRNLMVIAIFLMCLGIGAVFATSANRVAHATGDGFDDEYDTMYADIIDRYEQGLISFDEAVEEHYYLSEKSITVDVENDAAQTYNTGIMALSTKGNRSGNVSWIETSGAAAIPLRQVKVELWNGLPGPGFEFIEEGYTDENGDYSITYDLPLGGLLGDFTELSIIVYAESTTFRVARDWTAGLVVCGIAMK